MSLQFQISFFIRTIILLSMGADHHQEITFCEIDLPPNFFDEQRKQFSQEGTNPINSQSCTRKHAK
ncbi:unnamed protein product [Acanthoscelides obtectus]|uniref:Secreted protein n=1 Tax=Acanthoscelides obtectus TaxID=200917 RepID=A0A9P0K8B4_ACAOB|nr:unnamed protein product [Acanthoscelides obtectus]CAK1652044.1 hypothetical protein AOBTE_LOCUS17641 [Acanthoscelides obtectus]